jgi:hypothetical protein
MSNIDLHSIDCDDYDTKWQATSICIRESTHRAWKRWIMELEVDHDAMLDADQRVLYDAMLQLVMAHEREYVYSVLNAAGDIDN